MGEFEKVSLGFAEFVSQLLQETFDAVLSAQNYQIEKYSEFEKALSISDDKFKELYISDEDFQVKEIELFGVSITENMLVNENLLSSIKSIIAEFDVSKYIRNNKLTFDGKKELESNVIKLLVAEKRNKIRQMINKSDMVSLMVESGEIRAKLELTNLYQTDSSKIGDTKPDKEAFSVSKLRMTGKTDITKSVNLDLKNIADLKTAGIKVKVFEDEVTKHRTLIIDKKSIQKTELTTSAKIPDVRIVAAPAQVTSNSNLFSEVIIKFKTV